MSEEAEELVRRLWQEYSELKDKESLKRHIVYRLLDSWAVSSEEEAEAIVNKIASEDKV